MNIIICILIVVFLLVFQLSFLSFVLPSYFVPNIILGLLICSLLFIDRISVILFYGFFAGIFTDILSGNIVGFSAVCYLLIILFLIFLKRKLAMKSGFNTFLLFLTIASLLYDILIFLAMKIDAEIFFVFWSGHLAMTIFGGILMNLIFGSMVYFLWRKSTLNV